jgi:hypothetical protein
MLTQLSKGIYRQFHRQDPSSCDDLLPTLFGVNKMYRASRHRREAEEARRLSQRRRVILAFRVSCSTLHSPEAR